MIRQARECARRVQLTKKILLSQVRMATARPAEGGLWRNGDAIHFAVADTDAGPVAVAIVCDGVSSAPRPDEASWTAVNAGITLLAEGTQQGQDLEAVSTAAVKSAGRALTELAGPDGAPASTY